MTVQTRLSAANKRELPIQQLVEWAFRKECVQLDLPDPREAEERGYGFGMEYILIQRAKLGGVRIDTSIGRNYPHEDAETVAAILAALPQEVGGIRMAIAIAEHARAGNTPDWMPNARPKLEPLEWQDRWWGIRGRSEVLERVEIRYRGRKRAREVRYTPCRWVPSQESISAARRAYSDWWVALHELRERIRLSNMLRCHVLSDGMPPAQPWAKNKRN